MHSLGLPTRSRRCPVGPSPRSAPLPPKRKWWVERMAPGARRSHLLAEYLEGLADRREGGDSASIRAFLSAWRKASAGDNALGVEIKAHRAKLNTCVLFVYSTAAGPVRWLPTLVLPWSHHVERIRQECGDSERFP